MNPVTISVVIADSHEVVRLGLRSLFSETELKIVADAKNGADALKLVLKHKPDVLLLDVPMHGSEGLDALEKIRQRSKLTRVVIFSNYDNPAYITRAHNLGAADYLLKGCSQAELVQAIRQAVTGAGPIRSGKLYHANFARNSAAAQEHEDFPLTPRESQTLKQIAQGQRYKEIARAFGLSVETVKEHVRHLFEKLGVSDRTQAAVLAIRKGLA